MSMEENKKKWIIGGVISGVVIVAVIIILAVTLTGDDDNDGDKSSSADVSEYVNDQTNVLFIIVDDLGWGDVPSHGSEFSMDNLDKLYQSGIEFTNYYVHPVCTPTRAAFLTGKYAWKLGLQDVQTMPPGYDQRIPEDTPTVAEVFSEALNYETYYVGKWHLGYGKWAWTPTGRGFNYGFGILQSHGEYYEHTNSFADHENLTGYDMFNLTSQEAYWEGDGTYSTDLYYDQTLEYLSYHASGGRHEDKPFYMYLSWQTIHEPMEDPPITQDYDECLGLSDLYDEVRIYCNKLKYFDEKLGGLLDYLEEKDLDDNTLIVVTTDNGGMPQYETSFVSEFFFHRSYGCNYPYRGGKITMFEGGVKGIGLMSGNIIEELGLANSKSDLLLHGVDWYNTLLEQIAGTDDIKAYIEANMADFNENDGGLSSKSFDGVNIFDYLFYDIDEGMTEMNRLYVYPNIEKENPLVNTTNETIEEMAQKLIDDEDFDLSDLGLDDSSLEGVKDYISSLLDTKRNLDCVVYYDVSTQTQWKYARGEHMYWNSYNCDQTYYNYDDLLYIYNAEWLFDLTNNPEEDESLNYLNPTFDFENSDVDESFIENLATHLREQLDDQFNNNGYQQGQNDRFYCTAIPQCHNGTWHPWLDEDGNALNDHCSSCSVDQLLQDLGFESEDHMKRRYWD